MAYFEQLPGKLNLAFRAGDPFSVALDFNPIALTGLTLSATIRSVISGAEVASFTVTVTDAALGQCTLSLTGAQTLALPRGTFAWELAAANSRTFLAGFVEVSR